MAWIEQKTQEIDGVCKFAHPATSSIKIHHPVVWRMKSADKSYIFRRLNLNISQPMVDDFRLKTEFLDISQD